MWTLDELAQRHLKPSAFCRIMTSYTTKPMTKLFQYDKKVWDDNDTDRTWQFGILKNHSLLWVHYEYPSRLVHSNGGLHIMLSFFTSSSLFAADFQVGKIGLSFNFFTEYFDGWEE